MSDEGIEICCRRRDPRGRGTIRRGRRASPCARAGGEQTIEGSDMLVAAGRMPNTAGIGLEMPASSWTSAATSASTTGWRPARPDVWAIGECAGSPQFTHVSVDDFRIVRDNLAGGNRSTRDRLVPYCMFTDPPLAHVGLSEREAQRQGIAVRVAKLPMSAVLRTQATDETQGFMKVLVGATTTAFSASRCSAPRRARSWRRCRRRCWRSCPIRCCATRSSRI